MRREGRQHGMVRTRPVLVLQPPTCNPDIPKSKNVLDRPPIAGVFDKVPTKPTNHSKFTGRCGKQACVDCRSLPTAKSKKKTKGSTKFKSALLLDETYDLHYDESPEMTPEDDVGGDRDDDDREEEFGSEGRSPDVVILGESTTVNHVDLDVGVDIDLIVSVGSSYGSDGYDDDEIEVVVVEDSGEEEWFVVDDVR